MRAIGLCLNPLAVGQPTASTKPAPVTLTLAVLSVLLLAAASLAHGQTERVLHSFAGGSDGANPHGGLVLDATNLYGSTQKDGPDGTGTVFKLTPSDGTNPQGRGYSGRGIAQRLVRCCPSPEGMTKHLGKTTGLA
jgi:uncharacterized repeat protein (TIGR03803 family)